jgi:hypothetical protein
MVITTPTIVYRQGDDVPGERIRKILVYEERITTRPECRKPGQFRPSLNSIRLHCTNRAQAR